MPSSPRLSLALAAAFGLLLACEDAHRAAPPAPLATPTRVSGGSPYPAGCNPAVAGTRLFSGAEVEPHLAVDPTDPQHLVAAWQQDRWSGGGANGIATAVSTDGGHSWVHSSPAFTRCAGGTGGPGHYDRATDPWLSFAPDGTLHLIALTVDNPWQSARQAILASRSADGGLTWSDPVALAAESSADLGLDKCTLTADPGRRGHVYAVWDRLTGRLGPPARVTGPTWFARSTDGGASWEAPRTLYDPGANAQTISGQIAVLPDGTLACLLVVLTSLDAAHPPAQLVLFRSGNAGTDWSAPIPIASLLAVGTRDPASGQPVRDGAIVPQIAVDPASGALHVAWQDARWSGGAYDAIALSSSSNGGLQWSSPARVSQAASVPAFTPSIAVAGDGRLGLSYYDLRTRSAAPGLWTVRWLATSIDGGATWEERPVGGPFDLRQAPEAGGLFLGDYQGLVGLADGFVALFGMSGAGLGASDVFVLADGAAAAPAPDVAAAPVPPAPPPLSLAQRARLRLETR